MSESVGQLYGTSDMSPHRFICTSGKLCGKERIELPLCVCVAWGDAGCFIRELLLTFSLSSTTCNSAWVSRGFSVIKHV